MHDRDEQQIDRYQIDKTERKKGGQVERRIYESMDRQKYNKQ
jgi:hypothetical protein